ncbi:MAG TPA: hypothetical protein VMZ92_05835, partial [Planctomycetota bacterium]|nr:hypothetical protein [Planctomycetota bacterium]
WKKIRARRRGYICVLLLAIALAVAALMTGNPIYWAIRLAVIIVFLILFLGTAHAVLGYPAWKLVLMAIGILIPFVSLIVLGVVDHKVYARMREASGAPPLAPVTGFAYFSLLLCIVPVVGLALSIIAVVRIRRSAGALRGMAMSIVAMVISALITGVCLLGLIASLLQETT